MNKKLIPGFPGYFATTSGDIVSTRSGETRIIGQRIHKGYYHVNIKTGYGRKTVRKEPVHKLILLAFRGEKPNESAVCRHLNGNALDNRLSNLKWGTHEENLQDSIRHGTAIFLKRGEEHPCSKLKLDQVTEIKKLIHKGLSNKEIAALTGVKTYNVNDIRKGRSGSHVTLGVGESLGMFSL